MSVLVKGMAMPESCKKCMFGGYGGENLEYHVCQITGKSKASTKDGRIDDCPLIEVQTSHGRLIDVDVLLKHAPELHEYIEVLAETVIEAEE